MATNLIDTTVTYTGRDLDGFYSTALLTGDTKSLIRLVPNVKSKVKLASLNMSGMFAADNCEFSDTGVASLSQKTLEVCPIKINLSFCERDFEANYLSEQLRAGSNKSGNIPKSFTDYMLNQVALNTSAYTEKLLWQGDTTNSPADLCDGLLTHFDDDSTIGTVNAVSGGITVANVIAEVGKVYDAIPCTIIDNKKVVIFVSCKIGKAYKQALAGLNNFFATYNTGDLTLSYLDTKLIVSKGLPDDQMVACDPQNLWFGTDLVSDENDLMFIPQKAISGAPTVRIAGSFKFGTQFGSSTEIVWYA